MNKLPAKTATAAAEPPNRGRRQLLAYLGLAAIAAYAAPLVVQIGDEAQAGSRSDGRGRRHSRRRGGSSRSDGRRRQSRRNDGRGRWRADDRRRYYDRRWYGYEPRWHGGWRPF
jgi:hypothetical protein